jgi:lysophospholipase L1-like esterase
MLGLLRRTLLGLSVCFLLACSNGYEETELCFIGDSITELWDLDYYFPEFSIVKISKSGAKVQDALGWDVASCEGRKTVVLIGTNDIGYVNTDNKKIKETVEDRYVEMLKKVPYESVVVVSILPRNLHDRQDEGVNKFIESFNQGLKDRVVRDVENGTFVDVFPFFLDDGYEIKKELFNDGLHPSPAGYEVLSNELKKFL